jgi:hypothetical protein
MNEEKSSLKSMQINIYKLGSIAAIFSMISIAFAIVAYFIWPYKGHTTSIEAILNVLQSDRIGALISLDVSMLIIFPIAILTFLAIYYVLKRVDEPIAFFALVLNFTAFVLVIVCRPLVELTTLSNQFALATDAIEKAMILAAGEALRIQLDGTAWAIQTAFFMIAGLINNILMLRSAYFKKKTAWTGIVISAIGLPFFLPEIGLIFLFLNTIGSIPWLIFVAHDLNKVSKTV